MNIISRWFKTREIIKKYNKILLDYCDEIGLDHDEVANQKLIVTGKIHQKPSKKYPYYIAKNARLSTSAYNDPKHHNVAIPKYVYDDISKIGKFFNSRKRQIDAIKYKSQQRKKLRDEHSKFTHFKYPEPDTTNYHTKNGIKVEQSKENQDESTQ